MRDFRAEDISLSTKNGKLIINGKNEIDITFCGCDRLFLWQFVFMTG